MGNKSLFKIFFFFFLINPFIVKADSLLAYLDVQLLIRSSNAIQIVNKELNIINDKNQKIFMTKENKISLEREDLIKKKNVINTDEFNKLINTLENKIKIYNDYKNKTLKEFDIKKKNADIDFANNLDIILDNYSKKNSIDFIIKRDIILFGAKNFDITSDIINIFNKKIKKINF